MSLHVPEKYRVLTHWRFGKMDASWGNNGVFEFYNKDTGHTLYCVVSDGGGWEHVSVTIKKSDKTPSWPDMALVKDTFWDAEDAVMQLHPPQSQYVNNEAGCLHLWRPLGEPIPLPPSIFVGVAGLTPEDVERIGVKEINAAVMSVFEEAESVILP